MKQFLKDIISTLYSNTGEKGMSLFRLSFAVSFVVFICIAIADFCVPSHHFEHYGEFSLFVGSLGGLCCGNKLVSLKEEKSDE